eukprot:3720822-Rhodomonas_salina.1
MGRTLRDDASKNASAGHMPNTNTVETLTTCGTSAPVASNRESGESERSLLLVRVAVFMARGSRASQVVSPVSRLHCNVCGDVACTMVLRGDAILDPATRQGKSHRQNTPPAYSSRNVQSKPEIIQPGRTFPEKWWGSFQTRGLSEQPANLCNAAWHRV